MMKQFLTIIVITGITTALITTSCNNSGESKMSAADSAALSESKQKAQKVFFAIPSPLEMANMIKQSGASFNKSILNPVANASKYTTALSQAVNLGIYSADLSYCSSFDQTQEAMQYMSTCKKMADALGVTGALSENILNRLEKNSNNKDSLLELVSESYAATDAFLKDNDRASTTSLIVAGGWIEAIYISTRLAANAKANAPIISRIAEQKDVLKNLIALMESYSNDESLKPLLSDLKSIEKQFDSITIETSAGEVKTDESTGKTTIDDKATVNMSAEQLASISKLIADIRTKYTN